MNIFDLDDNYISNTYNRFKICLTRGKGSLVFDQNGNEYIDLGSGIAVNTFGYSDSSWTSAITEQLNKLQHTSNLYYTEPCVMLAQTLCKRTGMKKVFLSNSGAEANECAIKAARKYYENKYGSDKQKVILTLDQSFHGRTITTLSATGQDVFHKDFLPLTGGFVTIEPTVSALDAAFSEYNVAAIMFEPIRGEGGVLPLDKQFVNEMSHIADKHDALLIADEVQTGNGRSGMLYCYMHYGILPDIVTTAKGLGGGLPIGATLLGEKVKNVFTPGLHGSTFGGNPVCCAGALNIISRIDDTLLNGVRERGEYIKSALDGSSGIIDICGLGLMLGIRTEKSAKDIAGYCLEHGVLVLTAKDKIRLLPALNIPYELLERGIKVLKNACTV